MATLDEIRLQQLLAPFSTGNQTGIVNSTNALPMINNNPFINVTDQLMKFDPNIQNKSIVDQIIAENQMKTSQNFIGSPFLNVPRGTETISPNTGVPGVVEDDGNFRVIPGYVNESNNIYYGDAAIAKPNKIDLSNLINMGVANEPDQEQVKSLTEQEPSGIAKLFEFLQQFSPLRGLAALSDKLKQSSMYRPSTTGVFGYTPAQLNQMNALGGYYSAPERERRRRANRISNMLNRAAEGKNYSKKNLSNLMNQFGMGDVDTGSMIQSIKESSNMGYGKGDVGLGSGGGRDYSSSPGAMAGDMEYGEE